MPAEGVNDPDATPEHQFAAHLAREDAAGAMRRRPPSRAERWRSNVQSGLALVGVIAVAAAIGWWRHWR